MTDVKFLVTMGEGPIAVIDGEVIRSEPLKPEAEVRVKKLKPMKEIKTPKGNSKKNKDS